MDARDIRQNLGCTVCAIQGRISEIIEIFKAKLRRLRHDLILRPTLGIDPKRRRRLNAARQGYQEVVRDRLLGEPHQFRLSSIHIDIELRVVALLLNVQINRPWNGAQPLKQPIGDLPISCRIEANHLDIDRGWQTKIQDLTDHIGW